MFTSNKELVDNLVSEGYLKTPRIIDAFKRIDRADFVPKSLKSQAYQNHPLPIGYNQTISQPLTVAFMIELLQPKPGEKILDIGAGSGWQTTLIGEITGSNGKVVAVEKILQLKAFAEANIEKYKFIEKGIVKVVWGDATKGTAPTNTPENGYDKIIAAATATKIPEAWKSQLKNGGLIVAPLNNDIVLLHKVSENEFEIKTYSGFSFVPLVSD